MFMLVNNMSNKMQNTVLGKLRQSLVDKQYTHRFNQLITANIRINKQQAINPNIGPPTLLPSISNTKLALTTRHKSHSAKKISIKTELDKNNVGKSSKRLPKGQKQEDSYPVKTINFDDLVLKKQGLGDSQNKKGSTIRTKIFSLKTPSREEERQMGKQITQTKDITMSKLGPHSDKFKQTAIKQFTVKMDKLNGELLLSIKNGKIDMDNPDNKKITVYMGKLKSSNEDQFKRAQSTIEKILKFTQKHNIVLGIVELKRIIELSSRNVLSNFEIVGCFVNKQQIIGNKKIVGLQFYTSPQRLGKDLAANKIISLFKMVFSKRFYKNLGTLMKKVKVIQRYWRTCLFVRRRRKAVMDNIESKLKKYQDIQQRLMSSWNIIKTSNRFQIHICSYSMEQFKRMTIKNLKHRENNQITRIFRAMETDVNIIYVTPFQLPEEVMKYYHSIFNFHPHKMQEKIYFVVPENRQIIQQHCHLTTATALYYSPKALKRIRQIISGGYAFIVPSFPSMQYVNLAAELNVGVFGPNQNIAKLLSTKSGCLKVLGSVAKKQKTQFCINKSVQGIFSEKQLINSLSILIFKNKQVKIWYLKIEDQINSRGLAYLSINKIAFLRQVCSGGEWEGVEQTQMIRLIAEEISSKLKFRLKIVNKDIYANYEEYLSHFLTRGGLIEAGFEGDKINQFSISFLIQPSGEFGIVGTFNKLELGGKSISQGITFPSQVKNVDYEGIIRNLYKQLWVKRKLFGYYTADFLHCSVTNLVSAIGLDCFLNEKTSALFMVNFCCRTAYNKDRNCLFNQRKQELTFIYCPSMTLFNLPPASNFFKNCKYQNISFDLQKKNGTFFIMLDKLQSQQLGFVVVQDNFSAVLRQMRKLVEYFCREYRISKNGHDQIGLLKGVITTALKKFEKYKRSQIPNLQLNQQQ